MLHASASQRTTHRQMVLSRGSTGIFKQAWKHDDLPIVLLGIRANLKENVIRNGIWHNSPSAKRLLLWPYVKVTFFDAAPTVCSYEVARLSCSIPDLHTVICMFAWQGSHKPPLKSLTMVPSQFSVVSTSTLPWRSMASPKKSQLIPWSLISWLEILVLLSFQLQFVPHSPTLPVPQEHTSTPNKVPFHPPITTRAGRPCCLPAHLSVYLWLVGGIVVTSTFLVWQF